MAEFYGNLDLGVSPSSTVMAIAKRPSHSGGAVENFLFVLMMVVLLVLSLPNAR